MRNQILGAMIGLLACWAISPFSPWAQYSKGTTRNSRQIEKKAETPNPDSDEPTRKRTDDPKGSPFGLDRVIKLHIEMSPEEYQTIQPPPLAPGGPGGFGGPGLAGGPPPPAAKAAASNAANKQDEVQDRDRESERNLFGVLFRWGRGTIAVEESGFVSKPVGIRYAGNASYLASANSLKRSFLIDMDRFESQDFRGLRAIHLQSGALDPTQSREAIAYRVFRDAGVPAPRTALAEVTLTVPGRYDKARLGLYTLVEPVDETFLKNRFGPNASLLLKPQGMRGIDDLGEDWAKYAGSYRPLTPPEPAQAKRLMEFAKLIQETDDERFREKIESYLDVDEFLRFMSVQAMIANADGFFTMGYNYALALDPRTDRFVFVPGDQELSFANFMMMGTPDQLMDMSLTRPYGERNPLADRLLKIKSMRDLQQKILKELTSEIFTREKLIADIEAIGDATRGIKAREGAARVERREPPAGFGFGPAANNLRMFVDRRIDSIADQLAGKRDGYHPRFQFGPPPAAALPQPVNDATIGEIVSAPPGFKTTLFAAPPKVGYPVAVSAAPDGAVYVAIDEQGSLGRSHQGGRVVRCEDLDGDGKADRTTVFAEMEHPRGIIAEYDKAWVLHPPFLTLFHDQDGDGVSDRREVLATNLTTSQITDRGGDHTTNGIRMGIDGWIYIAVGDYGFHQAKGTDGRPAISQRGGGILRIRADGSELEPFATGLRNPFAIAIDPYLNLFTRDNTNDGAGWDVRVSHLVQTGEYGYPRVFLNFPEETMPTLGVYGQGGGTGALALNDERWPKSYRGSLLTGDWGRSEIYRHQLAADGASYRIDQTVFLKIPRPTGMDVGVDGRLYAASWRGGEASVYVGPQVGFVACVAPPDWKPPLIIPIQDRSLPQLVEGLGDLSAASSFRDQREIIRRGPSPETTQRLDAFASDESKPAHGRIAALFALKQLDGAASHPTLKRLAQDAALREYALRALTDRKTQLDGVDSAPIVAALADPSPRVRAQAAIALGRLGDATQAASLIPLAARPWGTTKQQNAPSKAAAHARPDPDRATSHLAIQALIALRAIDACLNALDGPNGEAALIALRQMHDLKGVEGLIKKLSESRSAASRRAILSALARLHHREADYDGSWWGIRPDTAGPYFDPKEWEGSSRIASVLKAAILDSDSQGDSATASFLRGELARYRIRVEGLNPAANRSGADAQDEVKVVIAKADPSNPDLIANMTYAAASAATLRSKGDPERGRALFAARSCRACHTDADGQTPKGPHLVDIGKRYSTGELIESILKPSAKIAQGYEAYVFAMDDGRVFSGFIVSEGASLVTIREPSGRSQELKRDEIEQKRRQDPSTMPEGIAGDLTPRQLADLVSYLQSLTP